MSGLSVGFIGLGLIGGSIAKALRAHYGSAISILAFDADAGSMAKAVEDGTADRTTSSICGDFSDCDVIYLCAPVGANVENAIKVRPFMKEGAVLTDVGSVKGLMHEKMSAAGIDDVFVGGHPMAGSERIGYANSKENLFVNAYYIITRTGKAPEEYGRKIAELAEAIGAIPLPMDPEEHDRVTAAVSHVPHII